MDYFLNRSPSIFSHFVCLIISKIDIRIASKIVINR
jgi:hypothetical protein